MDDITRLLLSANDMNQPYAPGQPQHQQQIQMLLALREQLTSQQQVQEEAQLQLARQAARLTPENRKRTLGGTTKLQEQLLRRLTLHHQLPQHQRSPQHESVSFADDVSESSVDSNRSMDFHGQYPLKQQQLHSVHQQRQTNSAPTSAPSSPIAGLRSFAGQAESVSSIQQMAEQAKTVPLPQTRQLTCSRRKKSKTSPSPRVTTFSRKDRDVMQHAGQGYNAVGGSPVGMSFMWPPTSSFADLSAQYGQLEGQTVDAAVAGAQAGLGVYGESELANLQNVYNRAGALQNLLVGQEMNQSLQQQQQHQQLALDGLVKTFGRGGKLGMSGIPSKQVRRKKHNEEETRRRKKVNEQFAELALECASTHTTKPSILRDAVEKVRGLKIRLAAAEQRLIRTKGKTLAAAVTTGIDHKLVWMQAPIPQLLTTHSGRILDCNSAFANMMQLPRGSILNHEEPQHMEFLHKESAAHVLQALTSLVSGGDVQALQARYVRSGGEEISVLISMSLVAVAVGSPKPANIGFEKMSLGGDRDTSNETNKEEEEETKDGSTGEPESYVAFYIGLSSL